MNLYQFKPLK